jgi:hypothetical protein
MLQSSKGYFPKLRAGSGSKRLTSEVGRVERNDARRVGGDIKNGDYASPAPALCYFTCNRASGMMRSLPLIPAQAGIQIQFHHEFSLNARLPARTGSRLALECAGVGHKGASLDHVSLKNSKISRSEPAELRPDVAMRHYRSEPGIVLRIMHPTRLGRPAIGGNMALILKPPIARPPAA